MGAYENPQMIIDTQSAQHLQNLQSTISGAFANVAQSYASQQRQRLAQLEENAKVLKSNNMKAEEYGASLWNDLAKTKATDDTINISETFEPLIQEAVKLKSGLLNDTIEDRQAAIKKLSEINGAVDGFTDNLGTLSSTGTILSDANLKGIGIQGGIYSGADPNVLKSFQVLQGKLPGTKKAYYKDNNPNQLVWAIYDDKNSLIKEFSSQQMKQITSNNGELVQLVPDQTVANDTVKVTNNNIFDAVEARKGDKNTLIPNGRVKTAFLKIDPKTNQPLTKEIVVNKIDGIETVKLINEVDIDAIKKDVNLRTTLMAQVESLSDRELIAYLGDVVAPIQAREGKDPACFDINKPLDEKEKTIAINAYLDHFYSTQIMASQDVLEEAGNVVTTRRDTKPTKAVKETTKKATETEKSQSNFEKIMKEGGTIAGKGGLYLDVSIDENGVKRYYPYKIDSAGIRVPVEVRQGASNKEIIKSLAGQLGYTTKNL